jgi:hypothetical protein
MSKSINVGYTDTALSPDPGALNLTRAPLNFASDFRKKVDSAGEAVIVNITSPNDRVEKIRFASTDVNDIYKGSGIDQAYYSTSKKGVSVVVQLTEVLRVLESTDAAFAVDLPISCHLVLKVPNHELVTAAVVQTAVTRLLSGLYGQGATTTTRLAALLKGSLIPSEI